MSFTRDPALDRLRDNARASIALEEALIGALSAELHRAADCISTDLAELMWSQIRRHRIGIIKQRAVMGALGIDV